MAQNMRTPLKTAAGLGASKEGTGHFVSQRVSAVALAILVPWFLYSLVTAYQAGFYEAEAWLAEPVNAVLMVLLMTAAFHHMRLGMQVVVEDYIHGSFARISLLIANAFVAWLLWAAGVFAVLKVALG